MAISPPTTELGATNTSPSLPGLPGWASFGSLVDDLERSPALKWPTSVRDTYPAMRNDSQVEALFYATTLRVRRYRYAIDPNGARDEIVEKVSADYGLPIVGDDARPRPRSQGRFEWDQHLNLVLLALLFGHYFFEQVGEIGPDGLWHLRKLAPRAPHTIDQIQVADDGGLVSIRQNVAPRRATNGFMAMPPEIPVGRLVAYVWDQEPGMWTGRSMLRSVYREWRAKDELIRADVVKHVRNGLGVPTAKQTEKDIDPNAAAQALSTASRWRSGDNVAAFMPYGVDVELKGVQGTLPDALPSIARHDEAMSRRWLAMLLQLGQTETGSRALGGEFADVLQDTHDAIAGWACGVMSKHQLEDDVVWNYGEGEEFAPLVTFERRDDPELGVQDLINMVDKGLITIDPDLEAWLRARYQLPERRAAGAAALASRRGTRRHRPVAAAAGDVKLPDRPLRRQPYPQEVAARIDFDSADVQWRDARDLLVHHWGEVRDAQIADLRDQIEAANGDLSVLSQLSTDPAGADVIAARLRTVADQGAAAALAEAAGQGVDLDAPDLGDVHAQLEARSEAVAALLARSLSEAAGRKAVAITGGSLTPTEVADQVAGYLNGLTDTYLEDQFAGAVTAAQNAGRKATIEQAATAADTTRIYASELLDENTCEPCTGVDGTEYGSLEDAEADYPTGGYSECLGGPRCRGTLVAVYGETDPTLQEPGA